MKAFALTVTLFLAVVLLHAQSLNNIEQKISKQIDADLSKHLELLKNAVNINSGTNNIAGVKAVGQLFGEELKALGFTVEWVELPDSLKGRPPGRFP